ncbi:hypothetical protein BpHYR1_031190 [Brachionus plicatilis]|uniref:Uncharacterized protein n=1 Tax=Brachionus plicatilis TaxID=10195 RepID=A0A3M7R0V2_BRAPC|nr:hypothetical protein BpHYR1_031190 [Brachionus plicatilis]
MQKKKIFCDSKNYGMLPLIRELLFIDSVKMILTRMMHVKNIIKQTVDIINASQKVCKLYEKLKI